MKYSAMWICGIIVSPLCFLSNSQNNVMKNFKFNDLLKLKRHLIVQVKALNKVQPHGNKSFNESYRSKTIPSHER